jgi:hypothetical protein
VATWTRLTSVREGLAWNRVRRELRLDDTPAASCDFLRSHRFAAQTDWVDRGGECRNAEMVDPEHAPTLDRSSPASFAATALTRSLSPSNEDEHAIADELHGDLERETSPLGRATLAHAEATVATQFGDFARAHALMLVATESSPRDPIIWDDLADATSATFGGVNEMSAFAAWFPDEEYAWMTRARLRGSERADDSIRDLRRAYVVTPAVYPAITLADALGRAGRWAEVRAIGAQLATRQASAHVAGEYLLATADASQALFRAAWDRVHDTLREQLRASSLEENSSGTDTRLVRLGLELATVVNERTAFADEIVHLVFDSDPPRLVPQSHNSVSTLAVVCALASHDAALRCFERVNALVERRFFVFMGAGDVELFRGAESYARGDLARAVATFRPMAREHRAPLLLATVFDQAGDLDLADRVDEVLLRLPGDWNGANIAHVRGALRAERRSDRATAERLAHAVIDAWGGADVAVPAVAEMRALLARLERR